MSRHLIITADDYGPHWYINNGIIEAAKAGLITSVSVFCNNYEGYDFKSTLDELVEAIGDKDIGIGCHLSLTSGAPLTNATELINYNGDFYYINDFKFGLSDKHFKQVRAEIEAQIRRLNDYLSGKNIPLDHVSCHHGVTGLFTPYNDLLVQILQSNNWKCTLRNPLIITNDPRFKEFKPSFMKLEGVWNALDIVTDELSQTSKNLKIKEFIQLLTEVKSGIKIEEMWRKGEAFRRNGNPVPTYLIDIYYHQPHAQILKKLIKYFPYNGSFSYGEMMVHLGSGDLKKAEKHKLSGINTDYFIFRRNELKVLRTFFEKGGFTGTDIVCVPMKKVPLFRCLDDEGGHIVYGT